MLTVFSMKKDILKVLIEHIDLFESFRNVYIFGSIIKEDKYPNDIDILLIYNQYERQLLFELDRIGTTFDELYGLAFDFTVLSENEEAEMDFISRLKLDYYKVK